MNCLTVDDIVGRLRAAYIRRDLPDWGTVSRDRITNRDIEEWSAKAGLSRSALYDAIALRLALGFHSNTFGFSFCDWIVNDLFAVIMVQNEATPDLFWGVFLAFDAGEFYPNGDRSIDPIERFTRPQIAEVVQKYSAN
jgi:hypothetical protein